MIYQYEDPKMGSFLQSLDPGWAFFCSPKNCVVLRNIVSRNVLFYMGKKALAACHLDRDECVVSKIVFVSEQTQAIIYYNISYIYIYIHANCSVYII